MCRLFVTPNWPVCIATTLLQGSDLVRSTHCCKAVMWYVQHFQESTKDVIRDRASLVADLP